MSLFEKRIRDSKNDITIRYYTEEDLNKEDWNNLNQKINKVLENIMDLSNENIISTMRTVLKNYKEEYFELINHKKDNGEYYVSYLVEKLDTYIRKINLKTNNYDLRISYNKKNDKITVDYDNADLNLYNLNGITDLISHEIKNISKLINIKHKELTEEDIELIKLYKVFYQEFPNFNSEETEIKYQNMLFILRNYDIKYNIFLNGVNKACVDFFYYPYENGIKSLLLNNWIKYIKDFISEFDVDITKIENENIKEKSTTCIIANEIRKYINDNNYNGIDILNKISSILFEKSKNVHFSKYCHTLNEYKLIKRIDNELNRI